MQPGLNNCFELVGSRQHGVAARRRKFNQNEVSCLLNALGDMTPDGHKIKCLPTSLHLRYHATVAKSNVRRDRTITHRVHVVTVKPDVLFRATLQTSAAMLVF